jgi:hypothetical protein
MQTKEFRKNFEGGKCDLFQGNDPAFNWKDHRKTQNTLVEQLVTLPKFKPITTK